MTLRPYTVNRVFTLVAWLGIVSLLIVRPAHAQFGYQEIHSFESGILNPQTRVIDGGDGYIYGTTSNGGHYNSGMLYRVNTTTGVVSVVYHFSPFGGGPSFPQAGLTDVGDGFLYGTTSSGGTFGVGTIYKLEKSTGALTLLHSLNYSTEGSYPYSELTLGSDGYLYGTTNYAGTYGRGSVFKVDKGTGALTVVHAFNASVSEGSSSARIVDGNDGFLYGSTSNGGTQDIGTVYKVDRTTGALTTLHSFTTPGSYVSPLDLVDVGNGFLYGTTTNDAGGGTFFKVSKTTGVYTVLHSFDGASSAGYYVASGPVDGQDGFLYSTTTYGGVNGAGTVFKVSLSTDALTVVHAFSLIEGNSHSGGVTVSGNNLYGVAYGAGASQAGTVYKVDKTTGAATVYASFGQEPMSPYATPVDGGNGYLYGTTYQGGANNYGTIYKIRKTTGVRTELQSFSTSGAGVGYYSMSGLIDGGDGFLYGTTLYGSPADGGGLFRVSKSTDAVSLVHGFNSQTEGNYHSSGVTLGSDGFLYGTAQYAGPNGYGSIYRVDSTTGATTILYSFNLITYGGFTYYPNPGGVIDGGNGYLYGTTQDGGTENCGTLYKVNRTPPSILTVVYSFSCSGGDGNTPMSALIDGGDGKLYGTTPYGGSNGQGTVFRLDPTTEAVSIVHSFVNSQYQGYYPVASLLRGSDGFLYGTAQFGGQYGYGTIFVLDRATGAAGSYHHFNRQIGEGFNPRAALTQGAAPDDSFFGVTRQGGANGGGPIFKFSSGILSQTITVTSPPPSSATYQNVFFVGATGGGSGNPIVIAASGACSGSGNNSANITMTSGTGTCTVTFNQAGAPNYSAASTVTRTTTAAKASASVNGSNVVFTYDGTPKSFPVTTSPAGLAVVQTYSNGTYGPTSTPPTNGGTYTVVSAINDLNYQASSSRTLTINKAPATVVLSDLSQTYTGAALTPTATTTPPGLAILWANAPKTTVGSYSVTATISDQNYSGSANGIFVIAKATASVTLGNLSQTYTATQRFASFATTPTGLSASLSYVGTAGTSYGQTPVAPTNAGTYTVTATISDANYQGSAAATLTVAKATATLTLGNLTQTYNGTPRAVSVSTSPSGLGTVSITYAGSPSAPTNAGSYAVVASLTHANYTATDATGTLVIGKATATVSLGSLTQTYTGSALSPSVSTNPTGLTVDWTNAPQTNAGSYAVTATVNNANYQGSASGTFVIQKATATVTLGALTQTYTGGALTPTAATNPAGLSVNWTNAPQTNANNYLVTATVNDTNYQGSASGTFVIQKATATVVLGALTQTYTGSALTPTATTTPAGLAVSFTNAPQTNAGSYSVTATVNNPNYQGSASGTFVIDKATASVTLTALTQTYTGSALTPAASTSPVGLAIVWTNAPQTNAGSYSVTTTVNNPNYQGSASGTFVIDKAAASVTLTALTQTYTGSALTPAASTSPVGLTIVWANAPQTNAADYSVTATVNDPNYLGSASGTFVIQKATAPVTLSNLSATYDGAAKIVGATTTPASLTVEFAYSQNGNPVISPVNAGAYSVTATVQDTNYQGSATGVLTIAKAPATVTLGNLTHTYTGGAQAASASTSPENLNIAFTYTQGSNGVAVPVNAGTYAVLVTIQDANYEGSATGELSVGKATASLALSSLSQTYDGSPRIAIVTTTPPSLAGVAVTYEGSATAPANAGSFAVVATLQNDNYEASSVGGTLVIGKATASIALTGLSAAYDGTPKAAVVTTTPSGLTGVSLTYDGLPAAPTNAGNYAVVASLNNANYQAADGTGTLVIAKASASITLSNLAATYDGTPKSVVATIMPSGVAGLSVTYGGSTLEPVGAGTYAVVATLTHANYFAPIATGNLVIAKAMQTITFATLPAMIYGNTSFSVAANASSNLPISFAAGAGGGCTITGVTVTITSGGLCTITASQSGNSNYEAAASVSQSFGVTYSWSDILQPVNRDGSSIFKFGSTIPVKFQLTGASAAVTNLAAKIYVAQITNGVTGSELEPVSTAAADLGNTFRYDSSGGQYIFNLSTKTLSQGTWQIRIDLLDGVQHSVLISLKK